MNDLILRLRGFSLRWAVVIMFVCSIAVGLISIIGGHNLGLTGLVTAISAAFLYVTLAVHAIDNDEQAVKISYIVIVAYIVSAISGFVTLKGSPDFAGSMVNDIFNGNSATSSIESWTVGTVISQAPYSTLMNVLMIVAWALGFKYINKRYMFAWIMGMAGQIIVGFGTLLIFIHGITQYDTFTMLNNIGSAVTLLFLIALLTINDKKAVETKKEVKPIISEKPQPVEQPQTSNKTQQLFQLKELLDSGILTQAEFDAEKKKILNS